jgi:hypothetical protein
MRNWSTDEARLKKNKEEYAIWKLEQMVNFGLEGKKLKKKELLKYWGDLHIDPARKKLLHLFLYGTEDSY